VGDIVPPPVATTLTDLEQKALVARPDYHAAQAAVRIADAKVKLAYAADTTGRHAKILCKNEWLKYVSFRRFRRAFLHTLRGRPEEFAQPHAEYAHGERLISLTAISQQISRQTTSSQQQIVYYPLIEERSVRLLDTVTRAYKG
jgi:hypothetical protein